MKSPLHFSFKEEMVPTVQEGRQGTRLAMIISVLVATLILYSFWVSPVAPPVYVSTRSAKAAAVAQPATGMLLSSSADRTKVLAFVGIQTGFGSVSRRRAIRKTWLPSSKEKRRDLENALGLVVRFVLGTTDNEHNQKEVDEEIEEFGDFFRVDVNDTYTNLNRKTFAFLKAAYAQFDAAYYVKVDDDVYLQLDRLSLFLLKDLLTVQKRNKMRYFGCMKTGLVNKQPKTKWFDPDFHLLGQEYFLHANGPIYILSTEIVSILVSMPDGSLRMLTNEDTMMGLWMLAMNVTYVNEIGLCQARCSRDSIAVFSDHRCNGICGDIQKVMVELHQKEACWRSLATAKARRTIQTWLKT